MQPTRAPKLKLNFNLHSSNAEFIDLCFQAVHRFPLVSWSQDAVQEDGGVSNLRQGQERLPDLHPRPRVRPPHPGDFAAPILLPGLFLLTYSGPCVLYVAFGSSKLS